MKNKIVRDFKDSNGSISTMIVESNDNKAVNLNGTYKLASSRPSNFLKKHGNILTDDIGFKSAGFARVATLALMLSLVALVAMYLVFRY